MYHTNKHFTQSHTSSIELNDDHDYQYFFDTSPVTMYDIIQYEVNTSETQQRPIQVSTSEPDYEKHFAWLSTDTIKKRYELFTQYSRLPMIIILKKR